MRPMRGCASRVSAPAHQRRATIGARPTTPRSWTPASRAIARRSTSSSSATAGRSTQLCYRFVGNHEDASDLAQDVFIRAYRGLRGFKARASLGTWLYRIAVNVSLNRVSRQGAASPRRSTSGSIATWTPNRRTPHSCGRSAPRRCERPIAQLPRKQRATLILRVYHELPHQEIADILGSSVGAVKANFFHAWAISRSCCNDAPHRRRNSSI